MRRSTVTKVVHDAHQVSDGLAKIFSPSFFNEGVSNMEDPDPRNGGCFLPDFFQTTNQTQVSILSNLTFDQMLAAWGQLQDADLEDAADVIFAQVHPATFTFVEIHTHFHSNYKSNHLYFYYNFQQLSFSSEHVHT